MKLSSVARSIGSKLRGSLVASSLLLCLVSTALWLRSYGQGDRLYWSTGDRDWTIVAPGRAAFFRSRYFGVEVDHGRMAVFVSKSDRDTDVSVLSDYPEGRGLHYMRRSDPFPAWPFDGTRWWERLGFRLLHGKWRTPPGSIIDDTTASFPLWLVCGTTAIAPALWIKRRWRATVRKRRGLCAACGYDLRGSSDRCPECGAPAVSSGVPAPIAASGVPTRRRRGPWGQALLMVGAAALAVWAVAAVMEAGARIAETQPAPATEPAATQPLEVELMGMRTSASSVVFIIGGSTSMADKLNAFRPQLENAVGRLVYEQTFGVILTQAQGCAPLNMVLLPGEGSAVDVVDGFLVKGRFQSDTNLVPAIETAFSMHPEVIYIVADYDFHDNDAVLRRVRELSKGRPVRINTIAFLGKGDDYTEFVDIFKQIAAESGGTYSRVHVVERDHVGGS